MICSYEFFSQSGFRPTRSKTLLPWSLKNIIPRGHQKFLTYYYIAVGSWQWRPMNHLTFLGEPCRMPRNWNVTKSTESMRRKPCQHSNLWFPLFHFCWYLVLCVMETKIITNIWYVEKSRPFYHEVKRQVILTIMIWHILII